MAAGLQSRAYNQQVLQVPWHLMAGGGQTISSVIRGPEPTQHFSFITATDHLPKNYRFRNLIAVTNWTCPNRVWVGEGGRHRIKVFKWGKTKSFSGKYLMPIFCHLGLEVRSQKSMLCRLIVRFPIDDTTNRKFWALSQWSSTLRRPSCSTRFHCQCYLTKIDSKIICIVASIGKRTNQVK